MTLSSFSVSCDPNTISMLTFSCCNVKDDVTQKNIYMTMNGVGCDINVHASKNYQIRVVLRVIHSDKKINSCYP